RNAGSAELNMVVVVVLDVVVDVVDVVVLDVVLVVVVWVVEVVVLVDDVVVVVGVLSKVRKAATQESSTMASRAAVFPVVEQSFGIFASSFAKQPLLGTAPPSNLSVALVMQSAKFGFMFCPGVSAFWWHLRTLFSFFATHFFFPTSHFDCVDSGLSAAMI